MSEEHDASDTEKEIGPSVSLNTLKKKKLLQKSMKCALEESSERLLPKSLAQDIKLFEATQQRSAFLEDMFKAIMSVKPTSVESERCFSVGGAFVTKVRSRLSDSALSALISLKMFFKN